MNSIKRTNWLLFIALFIYNMLDALHTMLLLETGVIKEANPLMNYFISNYRISACFLIKIGMFVVLGIGIYFLHKRR